MISTAHDNTKPLVALPSEIFTGFDTIAINFISLLYHMDLSTIFIYSFFVVSSALIAMLFFGIMINFVSRKKPKSFAMAHSELQERVEEHSVTICQEEWK